MNRKNLGRRALLKAAAGSFVAWHSPAVLSAALSGPQSKSLPTRPKLIWIMLRGAMDSLHAVLPLSDPDLMSQRKQLVAPIKDKAHKLGRGFALHPELRELSDLYRKKQLIPIVATQSAAGTRSHFYAQDILESGMPGLESQGDWLKNDGLQSGWLNRAVEAYQGQALAVAHTIPLGLRGKWLAKSWYPDALQQADDDLYYRLQRLYQGDDELSQRLAEGLENRQLLSDMQRIKNRYSFPSLAASCATMMASRDGPDCAMLEMSGWDTHQNQVGRLDRQFSKLDQGIAMLRQNLADQWQNTVVVVTTEFGRTVAENGTGGTDHGTASAMFIAGGAVAGGRVRGRWPGLADSDLFEGRDLMPTSDTRQWVRAVLRQHWKLDSDQLDYVFPGVKTRNTRLIRATARPRKIFRKV